MLPILSSELKGTEPDGTRTRREPMKPEIINEARVALLIPSYNEAAAIDRVVKDFRGAIPHAEIFVYDNNSRDRTIDVARAAGATVRRESAQGKGNVVRRMFSDVEADVYVLVDGDATYCADTAPAMIELLQAETWWSVAGCTRRKKRIGAAIVWEM